MEQVAKHIIFVGRVQGVGFRFTARSIANRHNLTGMVRNVPDGTVEMLAQGHPDDVSDCIEDIKESFKFSLNRTNIQDVPYNPKYTDFVITFWTQREWIKNPPN